MRGKVDSCIVEICRAKIFPAPLLLLRSLTIKEESLYTSNLNYNLKIQWVCWFGFVVVNIHYAYKLKLIELLHTEMHKSVTT